MWKITTYINDEFYREEAFLTRADAEERFAKIGNAWFEDKFESSYYSCSKQGPAYDAHSINSNFDYTVWVEGLKIKYVLSEVTYYAENK